MSVPKMTRHDMKQDDLATVLEKTKAYLSRNPVMIRNGLLGVGGAVLLAGGLYVFLSSRSASASAIMKDAQSRFAASLNADGGAALDSAALSSFETVISKYSGSQEGRVARYYKGVLLARQGKPDEAKLALEAFLERPTSPLFGALARTQLAQVHAQKGELDQAAQIYQQLADDKKGAYPQDWALYYLADTYERQGKNSEAASAYQRIMTEFPNSVFIGEAKKRAKPA